MSDTLQEEKNIISPIKYFKFYITEDKYSILLNDTNISINEKWNIMKSESADVFIEENPRSAVIFEFYFQIIQLVDMFCILHLFFFFCSLI